MELRLDLDSVLDPYNFATLSEKELHRAQRYGYSLSVARLTLDQPKITPCIDTLEHISTLGEKLREQFRSEDLVGWDAAHHCWVVTMPYCLERHKASLIKRLNNTVADTKICGARVALDISVEEIDPNSYSINRLAPHRGQRSFHVRH